MPISKLAAVELNDRITAELLRLEPPFLGVNIIRLDDLAGFAARMQPVRRQFDEVLTGFRPQLRAITDYGTEKRMLVVNLYGIDLERDKLRSVLTDEQFIGDFVAALEVVNDWDFFVAREV